MNSKSCYRELTNYKYQLMEDFHYETGFTGFDIDLSFVKLSKDGKLTVYKNYAWDGASGPTYDSKNSMRGSLVHDALYQLMRLEELPQKFLIPADDLFRQIIIKDGMSKFRAWYWYTGLRLAKGKAAKPGTEKPPTIYCAP